MRGQNSKPPDVFCIEKESVMFFFGLGFEERGSLTEAGVFWVFSGFGEFSRVRWLWVKTAAGPSEHPMS